MKKALIVGASGLIGSHILDILLADGRYTEVRVAGRSKLSVSHPKLRQFVGNLHQINTLTDAFDGVNDVFIAIGTTQAKTPDKEAYKAIDFGIPVNAAQFAAKNGVQNLCVVSSMGANPKSSIFYAALKGMMEQAILSLPIPNINIVRPSLLLGKRQENRTGEGISAFIMTTFDFVIPAKFKAIPATTVAAAMVALANSPHKKEIWLNNELPDLV